MTPDFYASYISGSIGILIGNPLDLIKVNLQSQQSPASTTPTPSSYTNLFSSTSSLVRGSAAPILGYGALNAILFMTYNRTSLFLDQHNIFGPAVRPEFSNYQSSSQIPPGSSLWNIWIAGAVGGLATWIVSTPTEVLKCRAQLSQRSHSLSSTSPSSSMLQISRSILRTDGIPGFFRGGIVTALRDSIGYGFYFWSYELGTRFLASKTHVEDGGWRGEEAMKVLLCGGIAGVVTWASVFPLDVIKTRVQTQILTPSLLPAHLPLSPSYSPRHFPPQNPPNPQTPLLHTPSTSTLASETIKPLGTWQITKTAYRTEGLRVFWRGFTVCCVRAFIVNAVQWAAYEWIMRSLDPGFKNHDGTT